MAETAKLNLCLRMPFERAGVEFNIEVNESADGSSGAEFSLVALDAGSGDRLPFRSSVSPVLADWVRGYSRWLFRARIAAQYTDDAITGTFVSGLTAEQTLEGLQIACDMIRQRFELYEGSVVAGS